MADENTPGTPDGGTPATNPADAGGQKSGEPLVNYKEIVELRKETRETRDLLKQLVAQGGHPAPAAPPPPAPAPAKAEKVDAGSAAADAVAKLEARINEMTRDVAVKDALLSAGVTDEKARKLIALAVKAENPSDVSAFVAEHAASFKAVAAPAAVPKPVSAPIATGAPGVAGSRPDPGDLSAMDPATFLSLPREERLKRVEEFRSRGPSTNPYASGRVKDLTRRK